MDLASIASIIGAGSNVIGALLGRKKKAPGVDYMRLRNEAEAAGFNPLTALMYGGAQAYTYDYGPAMSRASSVGQAMSDFAAAQFERQVHADRLALDRDYFGLEEKRVALDEKALAQNIAGAVHGPVFGPASRVAAKAEVEKPHTYYEDVAAGYGPLAATVEGTLKYADDRAAALGRQFGPDTSKGLLGGVYVEPGSVADWALSWARGAVAGSATRRKKAAEREASGYVNPYTVEVYQ